MERKARRAKRFGLQSKHKDTEKTDSQSDEDTDAMYVILCNDYIKICLTHNVLTKNMMTILRIVTSLKFQKTIL